ncbi:hypothetical protein J8F10_37060 [Gemmata sp. G18]|uniref:Tetratricopeptide repeat protein n=1 Tax=Gemmata palustris TaxID=2822762 RepID=A0ABS5C4I2_9BACT|nr:hypothetical protein [Gemmata palustris]MBP3960865.1 hypothetical protein [Gemmata palustris]
MGRSAAPVESATPIEKYDGAANNPFRSGGYQLRVSRGSGGVVHHVAANDAAGNPLPEYTVPANLVIGSGTRGRSYLSTESGVVWQSPVSWFSPDSRWDLSPGFDLGNGGRRPISPGCLFCHVDRVEPVPQALNRYRPPLLPLQAAIGCERCHGPGELHVTERKNGLVPEGIDTSIVNPKHLSPELRASVCAQCHLQGEERIPRRGREVFEFRPGLPFEQFVTVFVRPPDGANANRSVGQFEQLEQSRCFAASAGQLGCTNCHDPHRTPPPAEREPFYRDRCNSCHARRDCSAPQADRQSRQDNCVACHMPRTGSANIPHTSVTDHRILRRPTQPPVIKRPPAGGLPLVAFQTGRDGPTKEERERDLGIALAWATVKLPAGPGSPQRAIAAIARDRLEGSLGTWHGDADAWLALSFARAAGGDAEKRFAAATRATQLAPGSDAALAELVEAALAVRKDELAEEAAASWVRLNPTSVEPHLARATVFSRRGQWGKAEAEARAALGIQPLHPEARLYLALCRHRLGDAAGGRKEADTAIGLATAPQQRDRMSDWYLRQTR